MSEFTTTFLWVLWHYRNSVLTKSTQLTVHLILLIFERVEEYLNMQVPSVLKRAIVQVIKSVSAWKLPDSHSLFEMYIHV